MFGCWLQQVARLPCRGIGGNWKTAREPKLHRRPTRRQDSNVVTRSIHLQGQRAATVDWKTCITANACGPPPDAAFVPCRVVREHWLQNAGSLAYLANAKARTHSTLAVVVTLTDSVELLPTLDRGIGSDSRWNRKKHRQTL